MDCNKDEAIKAKEIAERKFVAKDMAGAKKFALKAHALYPGLEGISQMLATLNVYASAENQMYGEADFYGVLGVTPQADDDTIRKQYRKLALMLHPDKNKSIGAEGAFKLISEAWSLLSDKNRKAAYDAKRSGRVYQQKAKPPSEKSSMPSDSNGFYNFAKATTSNAKINKTTSRHNGPSASGSTSKANRNTFWTVCHRCKMQYEYLRSYINHNLLCPNCHKPFFAIETPPPVSGGSRSSKPWNPGQHSQNPRHEVRNKSSSNAGYGSDGFQWIPFTGASGASSIAQAANVVQQTYEKVKRVREEAQAAKKREKAMKRKNYASENMNSSSFEKKRRVSDDVRLSNNQTGVKAAGLGLGSIPPRHGNSEAIQTSNVRKINSTRELSHIDLHNILMHKARTEILQKMTECQSSGVVGNSAQKEKGIDETHDKNKIGTEAEVNDDSHESDSRMTVDTERLSEDKSSQSALLSVADKGILDQFSIPVPDSDFHDFDKNRTEKAFGENQVWAVYDNADGMPRYYAMIQRVISHEPFTVRISWLNSKTNEEFSPLNWVASGSSKTCGDFILGRHETYSRLNSFSHKVMWTKGTRGTIRVFPRKGDVWALYRNWSPDWNELTADEVIFKYDMVEVLEDYDEWRGVVVIPLVKVTGFKAVFHQHLDPKQARRIPRKEICRFSYQVPSRLISGNEAPNAPKGCRELDPAALPLEFLKVIEDVKEKDIDENQATQSEKNTDDTLNKPADNDIVI